MQRETMELKTRDGSCEATAYRPDGAGPWPGVIFYMDGVGMRSAMHDMAARLSSAGYYVLLPDLFYRVGFRDADPKKLFSDPDMRKDFMERVRPSASAANVMSDTESFFAHLDSRPDVVHDKIGITGYCMGGQLALYAAGHFGKRFRAAASYHGGGLATDAPDSPHKLASNIAAKVYVAGAIEDHGFDDAQKARLDAALKDAGVDYTIETYNARHGWVPADMPTHDTIEAERHWATLLGLFGTELVA